MKLLVVGAAGLLGQKVVESVSVAGHDVIPLDKVSTVNTVAGPVLPIDITDEDMIAAEVGSLQPDWIVNTAAFTAVDSSEDDTEAVREVNVEGVRHLLSAADEFDARLLTISTDYVFDGKEGPYEESALRNPLGVYGASKAEMEDVVAMSSGSHLVVRTMVLYGAAPGIRKNFGLWVLAGLRAGEKVRAVTDQLGNPTLASDLARMLLSMVEQGGNGLYHAAGAERVSRYEFARRLARSFGYDEENVVGVTTDELGQLAERPLESGFVLDRLKEDFGLEPMGLEDSLIRFREEVERYGEGA